MVSVVEFQGYIYTQVMVVAYLPRYSEGICIPGLVKQVPGTVKLGICRGII